MALLLYLDIVFRQFSLLGGYRSKGGSEDPFKQANKLDLTAHFFFTSAWQLILG